MNREREQWGDYSADFRQMYSPVSEFNKDKREMYSYERPAYIFWSAFMNGLIDAGYTEDAAREWLCSKAARHMLDGRMCEELERIAYEYAHKHGADFYSPKECAKWATETKRQAKATNT